MRQESQPSKLEKNKAEQVNALKKKACRLHAVSYVSLTAIGSISMT
jgi:hypothetical protein